MKYKNIKPAIASLLIFVGTAANAGLIDSSSVLLNDADATQLETWLGHGDLDWDSIWYGTTGATSASWHSSVDDENNTVSIYSAINTLGQHVLVGGYTVNDWSGKSYKSDVKAFIFNLTQPEYQANDDIRYSTSARNSYFATFGAGHDLFGGNMSIGNNDGAWNDGYVNNHSYDKNKGSIDVGTVGIAGVSHTISQFRILALETFTFKKAAIESKTKVPEPSTLAIFALGIIGLASRRFKKNTNK